MKKEKGIDVCFCFDTTGSMYPCLSQVRATVREAVTQMFADVADIRIAVIAHGDYCDRDTTYVTMINDFSRNVDDIYRFIGTVKRTGGGDAAECYEFVLNQARTQLKWQAGRTKIIVLIGDDVPHPVGYRFGSFVNEIDWRNELKLLIEAGINVYGVHAMPGCRTHSRNFYEEIARTTGGFYLTLDQFEATTDLLMAACYNQAGDEALQEFEHILVSRGRMTRNMVNNIRRMRRMEPEVVTRCAGDLIPVPSGRFQVLYVPFDVVIKDFIEDKGISFRPGRGFYELSKSVKVQCYKEIILVDKRTGDIFSGPQVREMLGLMPQSSSGSGATERLKPVVFEQYSVFIQSTSYNRKLIGGTRMLYEVPDWDSVVTSTTSAYKEPAYTVPKKTAPSAMSSRKVCKKEESRKVIKSKGQLAYELRLKTGKPWSEIAVAIKYAGGSSASRAARKYEESIS